jgi:hypothetical protein
MIPRSTVYYFSGGFLNMDVGSAFTFMFDDEAWIKKIAIGGGIMLAGLMLSPILIGLLLFLPINGYMLEVIKCTREDRPLPLPEWSDFGSLFSKGLMVFVIGLIYYLPVILVMCPFMLISMAVPALGLDPDVAQPLMAVTSLCMMCVMPLVALIAAALFPAALIRYAEYGTLGSAFQFGEIFRFISSNIGDYIIVILLTFVAQFVAQFGMILCFVGIFFTAFWSVLVTGNLLGQLARKASATY